MQMLDMLVLGEPCWSGGQLLVNPTVCEMAYWPFKVKAQIQGKVFCLLISRLWGASYEITIYI